MTDDIRALKIIRRKHEVIWRRNPLCINFEIVQESCTSANLRYDNIGYHVYADDTQLYV